MWSQCAGEACPAHSFQRCPAAPCRGHCTVVERFGPVDPFRLSLPSSSRVGFARARSFPSGPSSSAFTDLPGVRPRGCPARCGRSPGRRSAARLAGSAPRGCAGCRWLEESPSIRVRSVRSGFCPGLRNSRAVCGVYMLAGDFEESWPWPPRRRCPHLTPHRVSACPRPSAHR